VCVALVNQHVKRMGHIVLSCYPLSNCTIFSNFYLINDTIFEGGGVIEHKMRVLILSIIFV
jgi:hypothetical protein